jgi:peptide/nickel transport system permease protein
VSQATAAAEPPVGPVAGAPAAGRSQWRLAGSRFVRNRLALAALVLFILVVGSSLAAPLYAGYVAHTHPFVSNLSGTTVVDGKRVDLLQQSTEGLKLGTTPIGPTWHTNYFLGADEQGRDVAARVLYGGRSSLAIGVGSALIACVLATVLGLVAGFFGGFTDSLVSRLMDLVWAFPVYLLLISLSTVLLTQGIRFGPLQVNPASLWLPTVIIGVVYVPYVFRPVRGQVLSVREKDFVEAAISLGLGNLRLMFSEILPNVISVVVVLLPLMVATTILTESALSFLGIGVQAPQASWGTIIDDGQSLLYTRPWVSIAPGLMIVLTVLSLYVLGDGIRDAIDPHAELKL